MSYVRNGNSGRSTSLADAGNPPLLYEQPPPEAEVAPEPVDPEAQKARNAWARVGANISRITPSGVAHFALGAIALVAIVYIVWLCWSAFVPFQIGLVLAYITLPLVNRMSKVMPRGVATLLIMLGELALILLFVGLWIPLVVQEVTNIVTAIPSREELRAFYQDLSTQVSTFPEPVQEFIRNWANQFTTQIRDNVVAITGQVLSAALGAILGVVVTITFFLSLLVLPTWLFSVLNGTPRMRRSAEQALPPLVRRDVWGVGREVVRPAR